jgi:hypothetical protein
MNRIRLLALGSILLLALTTSAQQTQTSTTGLDKYGVPTVEAQMKLLTGRLHLTPGQQVKMKPILQDLRDATLKIVQDKSSSYDEQLANVRPWRYNTDKRMREILNDVQKKELDQVEQEPHPEMHGNLGGPPPATR